MRLSTKGRYALEAMVLLASKSETGQNVSLAAISDETGLSHRYLELLFRDLKRHGEVTSKKGKYGGYRLSKHPSDISVGDIFRSVEGSLAPVKCLDDESCDRAAYCITRDLWSDIYGSINSVVDNISLDSLADDYMNKFQGNEE